MDECILNKELKTTRAAQESIMKKTLLDLTKATKNIAKVPLGSSVEADSWRPWIDEKSKLFEAAIRVNKARPTPTGPPVVQPERASLDVFPRGAA